MLALLVEVTWAQGAATLVLAVHVAETFAWEADATWDNVALRVTDADG
jgi:hypothetical protein